MHPQTEEEIELLRQFDTNKDGRLDTGEVDAARRAFMSYDSNNDGHLSEREKETAYNGLRPASGSYSRR